jgi:peptidoglycan/xylan/chitin deacetylase (PgdA/CDA1 family)
MWMAIAAAGMILLCAAYTAVPDLLFHYLHWGVIWRGSRLHREVALTFDDGPDPRYTEELLQLLRQYDARATFFLIGERARQNPELVRKIVAAGHEIGVHGMHHRHAWRMTPRQTLREMEQAIAVLRQITGRTPQWYRPPWGYFNGWTYRCGRHLGLKAVLWDVTARDWIPRQPAERIRARLFQRVKNGSIVLCHDGGDEPNTPGQTLAALRELLPLWRQLGIRLVPVSELKGIPQREEGEGQAAPPEEPVRWLVRLFRGWEYLFDRLFHVHPLNDTFRVSRVVWKGKTLFRDGRAVLQKGMPALELHFQNLSLHRIAQNQSLTAVAVQSIRQVRSALPDLARLMLYDPRFRDVQAVFGITILHRGAEGLGFHTEELPSTFQRFMLGGYMSLMLMIYHPLGWRRLFRRDLKMEPRLVWALREEIIRRYAGEGAEEEAQQTSLANRRR